MSYPFAIRPTKPRFIPTLDSFDILSRSSGEWYAIAAECGIDGQKLHGLINSSKTTYKRGIELEKKYKGSVVAYVHFKTAKSGQDYPIITFSTPKHSGVKETFNGYQWLKDNGYLSEPHAPTSAPTQKTEPPPAKLKPVKACKTCGNPFTPKFSKFTECPDCFSYQGKLKRYQDTRTEFETLPPVKETSRLIPQWVSSVLGLNVALVKSYLGKKGYLIADIQATGLDIRHGHDNKGSFIVFALRNIEGKTVGYQKIYDAKFTGYDGKLRDKDFIFYPNKASGGAFKQGSFAVLGDLNNAENGLFFCEGLATGISVFLATGLTVIVCLDAGNLEPVLKQFSHISKKYIAADNDYHADNSGNTGVYSALKAAKKYKAIKKHNARVFAPVLKDDNDCLIKCDFDDLRQAKGLDAVKQQLKLRSNPNEITPDDNALFKYCPEKQLKSLLLKTCYETAKGIYSWATLKTKAKELQTLFDSRNFTEFKARKTLLSILNNGIVKTVIDNNCFAGDSRIKTIDIKGLENAEIAAKIKGLKGIVIDNRQLGKGKTELMALLKTILEKTVSLTKEPIITDAERKAYFLQSGGVNIIDWQRITANQKDFSIWKALNEGNIKRWLNHPPVRKNPFCSIATAHRISLIDSLANRLGMNHYDRVKSYDVPNTAICLPSIPKFEGLKPDFLAIDEFRQTLEFLHDSGGLIETPLKVEYQLIEWINNAGLTIVADADFNQASLDWLMLNLPSMPIYWLDNGKPKRNGKTIQLIDGGDSIEKLINRAIDAVKAEKSGWLAFDSETQAKRAYESILAAGIDSELVLLLTGDNKGEPRQALFHANPDAESRKYQVIIHSPVISSGVSILTEFDFVGAGFYGVIPPNELLQMIARLRKANNIYVAIVPSNNHDRPTDINDLIQGHKTQLTRINTNGFIELSSFDSFRLKLMATRNKALNEFEQQFLILSQLKGYSVKDAELTNAEFLAACNNETVKTEFSTKDIKALVCEDVLIQDDLTDSDAAQLENKTSLTQCESYQLDKYDTAKTTGKNQNGLTAEDVYFFKYDNGLSKVQNFELVQSVDDDRIEAYKTAGKKDLDTHETRRKLPSNFGKLFYFYTVMANLAGKPVKRALIQQCLDFLHEHHEEVAINGLGNFKQKTSNIRKLQAFLEKCGYELVETGQESTGTRERIYTLQVNKQVKTYADNRKQLKELLLENDMAMA